LFGLNLRKDTEEFHAFVKTTKNVAYLLLNSDSWSIWFAAARVQLRVWNAVHAACWDEATAAYDGSTTNDAASFRWAILKTTQL
jgi:hypothetical protein